jgi:signal transduction histidine kinase
MATETPPFRILLVEDNAVEAYLLQEILADTGGPIEVSHAETMAQAEQQLGRGPFRAVLLDLSLPDSRGLESVERAQSLAPTVPVVVLTGLDDEAIGVEAIRKGAQDYLVKGHTDGRTLTRSIRYAVERKRSEEEIRALNADLERRVAERTAVAKHRADQLRALAADLTLTEQRERRRLAQLLHDHLQQLLVAARLKLNTINRRLHEEALRPLLGQLDELLNDSIDASRSLTVELSPPILYDVGLMPALDWLARHMRDKHSLEVEIQADADPPRLAEDTRVLLFNAVRELLFNVLRHAGVQQASVQVVSENGRVRVAVCDQGTGFDPAAGETGAPHLTAGFGLFSIRERVELIGGHLSIQAQSGKGTRVEITVPVA